MLKFWKPNDLNLNMYSTRYFRGTSLLLLFAFVKFFFANSITAADDRNFEVTCLPQPPKQLTFSGPLDESFLVNRTQTSIDVFVVGKTTARVTGEVFGSDSYKFDKFTFYWNTPTPNLDCCESYNVGNFLMARVIYFNTKYKNVDDASAYPDGIVEILCPVAANAPVDNPTFSQFEKIFKENITKPGDSIEVKSGETFVWFSHFSLSSVYKSFKGTYCDTATTKTYPCSTIVELPSDPFTNFISCRQYADTFGSIKDVSGKIINNPLPEIIPLTSPESHCGITVVYIKPL